MDLYKRLPISNHPKLSTLLFPLKRRRVGVGRRVSITELLLQRTMRLQVHHTANPPSSHSLEAGQVAPRPLYLARGLILPNLHNRQIINDNSGTNKRLTARQ